MSGDLASKKLEILNEALPAPRRIAVLFNPDDPITAPQIGDTEAAPRKLSIEARFFAVRSQPTLASAFKELTEWRADGVLWLAGQHQSFTKPTVELAAKQRLATMVVTPPEVRMGGLILLCRQRRTIPPRRGLRRQGSEGHQARSPACRATDQVSTRDKPEDCQRARPHNTTPRWFSVLTR
jgi:hypothetical protein